jgi:hypothetical protein
VRQQHFPRKLRIHRFRCGSVESGSVDKDASAAI